MQVDGIRLAVKYSGATLENQERPWLEPWQQRDREDPRMGNPLDTNPLPVSLRAGLRDRGNGWVLNWVHFSPVLSKIDPQPRRGQGSSNSTWR